MTTNDRASGDGGLAEVFADSPDPVVRQLFRFVRENSYGGQLHSGAPTVAPTLNFYVRLRPRNGAPGPRVAMQYRAGNKYVRLFLNWAKYDVPDHAVNEFRADLDEVFGRAVNTSLSEPTLPLTALAERREAFEQLFLKFRDAIQIGD